MSVFQGCSGWFRQMQTLLVLGANPPLQLQAFTFMSIIPFLDASSSPISRRLTCHMYHGLNSSKGGMADVEICKH